MRRRTILSYNDKVNGFMRKSIHKILVIRFSSIGDIVLTTPLVRCLKRPNYQGLKFIILLKKQYHEILSSNPYLSKIWLFDENFRELMPGLRAENFDYIIDLHKNIRSSYVRLKLRKPASSFPKLNFQKWLIVNLKINMLPPVHLVDRYFKALKSLGITNDAQGLDYFIPGNEEVDLSSFPEVFPKADILHLLSAENILPRSFRRKTWHTCAGTWVIRSFYWEGQRTGKR